MALIAQTEAQASGTPGTPGTPETPGPPGTPITQGPPGTKVLCPPASSISSPQPPLQPGEPTCLGSISCEIPQIPPL